MDTALPHIHTEQAVVPPYCLPNLSMETRCAEVIPKAKKRRHSAATKTSEERSDRQEECFFDP